MWDEGTAHLADSLLCPKRYDLESFFVVVTLCSLVDKLIYGSSAVDLLYKFVLTLTCCFHLYTLKYGDSKGARSWVRPAVRKRLLTGMLRTRNSLVTSESNDLSRLAIPAASCFPFFNVFFFLVHSYVIESMISSIRRAAALSFRVIIASRAVDSPHNCWGVCTLTRRDSDGTEKCFVSSPGGGNFVFFSTRCSKRPSRTTLPPCFPPRVATCPP